MSGFPEPLIYISLLRLLHKTHRLDGSNDRHLFLNLLDPGVQARGAGSLVPSWQTTLSQDVLTWLWKSAGWEHISLDFTGSLSTGESEHTWYCGWGIQSPAFCLTPSAHTAYVCWAHRGEWQESGICCCLPGALGAGFGKCYQKGFLVISHAFSATVLEEQASPASLLICLLACFGSLHTSRTRWDLFSVPPRTYGSKY